MRSGSNSQQTVVSTQSSLAQATHFSETNVLISSLAIALPIVVVCAVLRQRNHRATVMRQRIKLLNRLWQLNSNPKLS